MESEPLQLQQLIELVETRQPNGDPLTYLSEAVIVSDEIQVMADDLVDYFVNVAREAGASWAEIGACLGVSKQAAQKKFVADRGAVEASVASSCDSKWGRGRSWCRPRSMPGRTTTTTSGPST